MNEVDINARLRQVIRETLAMPDNTVRPAHQNAPIYKGEEYITVQLLSEVAEGTDNTEWVDGNDRLFADERIWGQRLMSANIQYYNGDAMAQLRKLASRLQSHMATQSLEFAGMGFVRASVTDLTGLLPDEIWQTRAVLRFDFYATVEDTVHTPLIVQVPLTTYIKGNVIEEIVPPMAEGGAAVEADTKGPPFLAYETAGGETVRLRGVNP
jgi:hypothetical protein